MKEKILLVILAVAVGFIATMKVQALSPAMSDLKTAPLAVCGTTPTLLVPSSLAQTTPPRSIFVQNLTATDIYIGGKDVTTSTGILIPAGSTTKQEFSGDFYRGYCIVASSTANLRVAFGTGYSGQ